MLKGGDDCIVRRNSAVYFLLVVEVIRQGGVNVGEGQVVFGDNLLDGLPKAEVHNHNVVDGYSPASNPRPPASHIGVPHYAGRRRPTYPNRASKSRHSVSRYAVLCWEAGVDAAKNENGRIAVVNQKTFEAPLV